MRVFHGIDNAEIARPTVLTLGVFDGLHLGHQLIMRTVVERARAVGAIPTVITFDPHPRAVLHPEAAPPLLQTLDQRLEGLRFLGIEQTIIIRFTREFAQIRAEDFLRDIVHERLQAREVYLGQGFAFGRGREGNIELLRRVSRELGFFADEVPEVRLRGQRISSSRIRELLTQGRVNLARRMLGRPYGVEGRVVRGAERGRALGFPTANLQLQNRVIPKNGVYVTAALIEGVWRRSVTNIGTRPTFEKDGAPAIETYVLDWSGDLYGDVVRVRFLHRLRDERRFASVEDLRRQIIADVKRAERYFACSYVRRALSVV
ncbi:bifunctional riboflavin kinase/FAD synthetase [Pyrinomonas methylaliphatogenes]|jgi:riboflavin kinase/FMN adenylyltransferase|uniref:Riboflavin biosynthesis protein n=1 Tax=Pyrinomonas methylaliphatogenes TaxID=454194 RepID=A0A0B6WU13_9BACT|nr:bifunctional riboflavin kinase/FAD synthetase [Pyrinomonas methylaliphatogenes]MBX5478809.1 bifunctional riboflavin kinase/FAD synthetase [Pyrinomonas methylaliphatogenes]CDM64516.1 riboflavin kinase/FMN adenylyltransferase [Pyrinomonas methylaliphatogenes]